MAYPDLVTSLPLVDVSFPGVTGWLLQGESRQAVFFRLAPGTVVPEHAHGAQWGFVVEGALDLTISGETKTYGPGESYFIAEGAVHGARCDKGALVLDVFADPGRYRARPGQAG